MKRKRCIIKIYKLCDESGYTYDMRVYLSKDAHSVTDDMTATHATLKHLTSRVEGLRHKIFMYNFFLSPRLFDDLDRRKINSCETVWPNRKDMPCDFGPKQMKLKSGGRKGEDQGRLDRIRLEGQVRSLHTNMDLPPADANFCDDSNCPVVRYNWHMGYINSSECMANSYSMNRHSYK